MKLFRSIIQFLGGISFAITLISLTTLFVIAGTFLESLTDSHHYASRFIYGNLLFHLLLWGFFVNILVSAMRRWPFQWRHVPFLITHLGLLMILGGALVKNYWGMQGGMAIQEGTASQRVFLSDTYALQIEAKDPVHPFRVVTYQVPLSRNLEEIPQSTHENLADLGIKFLHAAPHSVEYQETWIKDGKGSISGIGPFSIDDGPAQLHLEKQQWSVFALQSDTPSEAAEKLYLENLSLIVKNIASNEILYEGPYKKEIRLTNATAKCELHFNFSAITGFESPEILIQALNQKIAIPLSGPSCLHNVHASDGYLGSNALSVDLHQRPMLAFIQDMQDDIYFFAFDPWGQVHGEPFRKDSIQTLIAYDQGFGGYAIQAQLPFPSLGRDVREKAQLHHLGGQLRQSLASAPDSSLSPPLEALKKACEKKGFDFVEKCLEYLWHWDRSQAWLYPLSATIPDALSHVIGEIDWESVSSQDLKACYWTSQLIPELEKEIEQGKDLLKVLEERGWPLIEGLKQIKNSSLPCTQKETELVLSNLAKQIYEVADRLPPPQLNLTTNAQLLSAYLRIYDIHLKQISAPAEQENESEARLREYAKANNLMLPWAASGIAMIETPIIYRFQPAEPRQKLESNIPSITLEVSLKNLKEQVTLAYDRFGAALPIPVLQGQYLLRFLPRQATLPYRVRLRDARQISYANSSQPFSYESDLWIKDIRTGVVEEKTISMNNVHETWDGHRFYLANISPPNESAVQRVQLIVSHDPGKYFLTYPGAIILLLGIFLLFWIRPYRS